MTEVICSLIGGGVTLVGSVLTFIIALKQMQNQQEAKQKEHLDKIEESLSTKLETHKKDYVSEIKNIHSKIDDVIKTYEKTTAVIEVKIDNLEKKQDKHNNVIERTYKLESDVAVLQNKEKVSEHRLDDLEKKKD